MFERFGDNYTAPAVMIIFIVLLGLMFLCQTLGKLIFYLIARFKKTSYSGKEILDLLKTKNNYDNAKIKELPINLASSFYSYSKKKDVFYISKSNSKKENLWSNLWATQVVINANEKTHRTIASRWQMICDGLLMIVPYLLFLAMMLVAFIPENPNQAKYTITIDALAIIGWIFILVCYFWWMSWTGDFQAELEEEIKELDNRGFLNVSQGYLKAMGYIPFSIRTII